MIKFSEIQNCASQAGLELLSVSPVLQAKSQQKALKVWQKDYSSDLSYMQYPAEIYCDLKHIFPEVQSMLVFALHYLSVPDSSLKPGHGRIARYARGRDYHKLFRSLFRKFTRICKEQISDDLMFKSCSDAIPILERYYASQSGLGFIGKNSLLIRPKSGSFLLLGEVLCNQEIERVKPQVINSSCGSCQRCINQCPTNAIVKDYIVNSGKCISYLTIEKRGVLKQHESSLIKEWLFGCDICQEVCPHNYTALKTKRAVSHPDLNEKFCRDGQVDLLEIIQISSDDEYKERFQGSPMMRAKRQGLLRNALILLGNHVHRPALEQVKKLCTDEHDEVIKHHARECYKTLCN